MRIRCLCLFFPLLKTFLWLFRIKKGESRTLFGGYENTVRLGSIERTGWRKGDITSLLQ